MPVESPAIFTILFPSTILEMYDIILLMNETGILETGLGMVVAAGTFFILSNPPEFNNISKEYV
jgi:hypothetical protein